MGMEVSMKLLLLMRHAKSSWDDPGLADHDRPLNKRGKVDGPKMGKLLNNVEIIPEVILCSSAKRARQTVDYLLQTLDFGGRIVYSRELYHSGTEEYLEAIKTIEDSVTAVMIVAHNPGMEIGIEDFTGQTVRMPTSAIALIRFNLSRWSLLDEESEGELLSVWTPKELDQF